MAVGEVLIAERYRLLEELGSGGMGTVHLAEDVVSGERVALKLLNQERAKDPDTLARFVREARVGEQIKSEHVVKVVDAGAANELGGVPFLAMELLVGSDLERLVLERGRLRFGEVLRLFGEAAEGLGKAHRAGIVHRDLKPQNLFLHKRPDGTETLKILDFGLAKRLLFDPDAAPSGVATKTGTLLGTPRYMAPEQVRGHIAGMGPRTDLWAMGLVVVRLLTGEHYWRSGNELVSLMTEIVSAPMRPPRERWPFLPAAFDAWFLKSCAREVNERYASVDEQSLALEEALRESVTTNLEARAPARPSFTGPRDRTSNLDASSTAAPFSHSVAGPLPRRRLGLLFGIAAAVAVTGASALVFFGRASAPRDDGHTLGATPGAQAITTATAIVSASDVDASLARAPEASTAPPRKATGFSPAMP